MSDASQSATGASAALPALRSAALAAGRIAWREAGDGPALVLVHGIGGYSAAWRPQFAGFPGRRVVAWDAPGYGGSDPLPSPAPSVDDYADALLAWLDHLGVTAADFVGHSLGAVMVAALCRKRPALASRVAMLHPVTGSGSLPAAQREAARRARIAELAALGPRGFAEQRGRAILGRAGGPAAAAQAVAVMAEVPQAGYLAAWEAMCAADIFADLGCIRCPALVIGGSLDPVAPPATCEAIAARMQAPVRLLPDVGHYASIEAPDLLARELRDFLGR